MNSILTEGWVYVPVPTTRVEDVYRLLGGGAVRLVEPVGLVSGGIDKDDLGAEWTLAELAQFASGTTKTTRLITRMLDLLAAQPGDRFSTHDLVDRLGVNPTGLRGALAALSRHLKAHYPGYSTPFDTESGRYSLTAQTAAVWSKARQD